MSAELPPRQERRRSYTVTRVSLRGARALYRSFCDRENASAADRLTAEATLAAGRFFLRLRAIGRCVLPRRGDFPRPELPRVVLAAPPPGRPTACSLCATAR